MKKVFSLIFVSCLVLALGGCSQGDDDDDDDDAAATDLTGLYLGMIWNAAETAGGDILLDLVQNGTSLTGTMYIDNDGDGNFRGDTDDNKVGILATVNGSKINMDIDGGGIDFMNQSVYYGSATTTENLIIDCSFSAEGHAGEEAYSGLFNVHRIGTATVKGLIVANDFDLSASQGDLEVYVMYDLTRDGTMNVYKIESADDDGPLALNADYPFEFKDVTDGDFYLAAILDSDDDGEPEYFGLYGAKNAAESAAAYAAWGAGTVDEGEVATFTAKAGQTTSLGNVYLANVE